MILTIREFTLLKLPRKNHKTQKNWAGLKKNPGFPNPEEGKEAGGLGYKYWKLV